MSGRGNPVRRGPRSAWDWFPWAIVGSLVVVIAVNVGMIWTSVRTFPGAAGTDGFDLSNEYNRVIAAQARQAALGWRLQARMDPGRKVTVRLTGEAGAPLAGAVVSAVAERPIGPKETTPLVFAEPVPGTFLAIGSLRRGQWDVLVTARAGGHGFTTTIRLVAEERRGP